MADGLLNKASIILTPTGYKAGTLYNVAPVVEPYEDFDFARASVASRVNSSGLVEMVGRTLGSELVTNGDFDTDSDWEKQTNWTIANGSANSNGTGLLYQTSVSYVDGKTYKVTFDASITSGGGTVRLGNTTPSTAFTNGSNIFYLQTDASNTTRYIFFQGNSFVGSIDNVSVKEVIDTNNIPRISYDSNGDNGHILLEPTSTNLITYSEDFSESVWSKVDVLLEGGHTAPDGSSTAYKVTKNGSNAHLVGFNNQNTSRHKSIWAKTVSGTGNVYLLNQTGNNLFTLTNEWQRFDATHSGADFFYAVDFRGAALTEVILWGAQLEELSYATSYIPTLTGSTETRATETATGAGSADLINSTEGVLYAEIAALVDDSSAREITLSDGTANNRVELRYGAASDRIQLVVRSGGVVQSSLTNSTNNILNFNKVAVKWKANDFALWINGVEQGSDTSGSTPIGLNELQFNEGDGSGGEFYGKCKALAVFNEALSDSELTQLTT